MKYHFKVQKEGKFYWAQCIELKGCITHAASMEELEKNMKEALNLYLQELKGSPDLPPIPTKNVKKWIRTINAVAVEVPMRISTPIKNVEKCREVLLYLITKLGLYGPVAQTVLYKLLYFSDFDFYEIREKQFMGLTYEKNEYGVFPLEFEDIVKKMIAAKEIEKIDNEFYKIKKQEGLSLPKSLWPSLNEKEVDTLQDTLHFLRDMDNHALLERLKEDVPWCAADDMEIIDYEAVFYRGGKESPTKETK